jgi:hypothetical protein
MKTLRTLCLALLASGCPGGSQLNLPSPPSIDKFTATPATVMKGGMVALEWVSRDGDVEVIEVGKGPVAGVTQDAHDGSVMVPVDAQSLFVLNVTNARGVKVTAQATVSLEGAGSQVLFAALPAQVPAGGSTTLVWTAPGARSVSIAPMGGAALDLHGQLDTGSVQVSPTAPTRYTLVADGVTKTVDVTVAQAITSFTASKPLAASGDMVTLSWKTRNATKVTLSQPARGTIATESDAMKVADGSASDTLSMFADGTMVPYLLTVEGAGPPVTQTVSVVVGSQPVITRFLGPSYAKTGAKLTLSWTTANADAIELATSGVVFYRSVTAAEAALGSLQLDTPAQDTDYTLYAVSSRAGVRVSKLFTQRVVGTASITTFTALPGTVPSGGSPVTLTWNVPNARHVRITDSDGVTVASGHGPAAEMGTQVAYPNGVTTYTLSADNTLEVPVTSTAMVTVTAPAAFGASGTLFAGNPFSVSWTVGGTAGVQGFASPTGVALASASTGFVDISTTGTKLAFSSADDATASFTPPDFETFVFGARVTGTFTASTNGFVALVPSALTRATPTALPNSTVERNFLAPFWSDLQLGSGAVYWQVLNEAPDRTLVVQFDHVTAKAAGGSDLVFEIKVHQTGAVTFEYKTLSGVSSVTPIIGVQGPPNAAALSALPPAGGSSTFFGPVMSPLLVTATQPDPVSGFIKLTNGYLHATFTPSTFVRPGQIGITEVMYSPNPAIATTGEWLEISNRSPAAVDLAGWSLDLGPAGLLVIDAGLPLAPGSSVLLGQTEQDAGNDDVPTRFVYGTSIALSDDAGTASLFLGGYRSSLSWNALDGGSGGQGVSVNVDTQSHLVAGDTSTTLPHSLNCSSKTPFGTQTPQQKGSPGASAPCLMTMSSIPPSFFDISGSGAALFTSGGSFDEGVYPVMLTSAPFPFQGASVASLTVSTNGWLILKSYAGAATITNKTVPSTSAPSGSVLAVFWDDLDHNLNFSSSNGYYKRVAVGEDPANPGAHWIIQWSHYTHYSYRDDLNFQVKLFDTGVVEYHYAAMTSDSSSTVNYGNGNSATVWLEGLSGTSALVSSVNQPVVMPNTALRFTP